MRIEQITFSRFLAAILIVFFHFGNNSFPFNIESLKFFHSQMSIGVSYFFILSGFVMIVAYSHKSDIKLYDYSKNRFARIYPALFLSIIIYLLPKLIINHKIDYIDVFLNLTALQSWVPGRALGFNSPAWSLGVEFFCYALFPLLLKIYTKKSYKELILPIVLFWLFSQLIFNILFNSFFYHGYPSVSHDIIFYFPLMHLNEFLIGNLVGLIYINKYAHIKKNFDFFIIMIIFAILITLLNPIGLNIHNGLLAVYFIPLILLMSMNDGIITKISKTKFLIYLGEISYGIYIYQLPVFYSVRYVMRKVNLIETNLLFYIPLVLLLIFSAFSYNYFETPIRKWITKKKF